MGLKRLTVSDACFISRSFLFAQAKYGHFYDWPQHWSEYSKLEAGG